MWTLFWLIVTCFAASNIIDKVNRCADDLQFSLDDIIDHLNRLEDK